MLSGFLVADRRREYQLGYFGKGEVANCGVIEFIEGGWSL